jgi:hypothetical protein
VYDSHQGFVELNYEMEPQAQVENNNNFLFRLGIQQASPATAALLAGFTLPVVTGPVTAVTGLDRLRYRPVTNRWVQKILNLNSKN